METPAAAGTELEIYPQVLKLLEGLTEAHKPAWGSMTGRHMVEHLIQIVQMSNGKRSFVLRTAPEQLPAYRAFLLSDKPMPRNIRTTTSQELPELRYSSLEAALQVLARELAEFEVYFEAEAASTPVHPIFGPLRYAEWLRFHDKHFRHHLLQFGLIAEAPAAT